MNVSKKKDLNIKFEMKMSEAQFIVDALAGVKFKCDNLIEKLVGQVNPQLPKVNENGDDVAEELPVGISEEVDDKILALFSEEWNKGDNNIEFDFSQKGHVVAICKFSGKQANALIKKIKASEVANDLTINVNQEQKGVTVFLFSETKKAPAPTPTMTVVEKEPAKKAITEAEAQADLEGKPRPSESTDKASL